MCVSVSAVSLAVNHGRKSHKVRDDQCVVRFSLLHARVSLLLSPLLTKQRQTDSHLKLEACEKNVLNIYIYI